MSCIRLLFPPITFFALGTFVDTCTGGMVFWSTLLASHSVLASFHLAPQCFIIVLFPQLLQVLSVWLVQHAPLVLVSTYGSPASLCSLMSSSRSASCMLRSNTRFESEFGGSTTDDPRTAKYEVSDFCVLINLLILYIRILIINFTQYCALLL